jgi:hypothetical protein
MNASRPDSPAPNRPSPDAPAVNDGPLTPSQREFAKIVGRALAEEWRRHADRAAEDHAAADHQPTD